MTGASISALSISTALPLIEAGLQFIEENLPKIGVDSTVIQSTIDLLVTWLPTIVKEAEDLVPIVKGIIATLMGSDTITDEQLAALKQLDQQCDGDFDAAVAAYDAAHPSS